METRSATRGRSTRKPLSDCTNTRDSQHSSSSSVASTSFKHFSSSSSAIILNPTKTQKTQTPTTTTIQNKNAVFPSTPLPSRAPTPSSSLHEFPKPRQPTSLRTTKKNDDAAPSTSTPSRVPNPSSSPPGAAMNNVFRPSTVYRRRQSADKRKSTCDPVAWPDSSFSNAPRKLDKMSEVAGINQSTLSKVPCLKKQCRKPPKREVHDHGMPQDFIEKQRAYFAEIDAFELSEEEVASTDESD